MDRSLSKKNVRRQKARAILQRHRWADHRLKDDPIRGGSAYFNGIIAKTT
jgi:hypothetical protein